MKNVILFGAGASRGSPHIQPEAPPLGRELFAHLAAHFPTTWGALPAEYQVALRADFEQGLLKIMDSGQHWISPLMQTMTLLFASYRPDSSGLDLYSQLLRGIRATGTLSETLFSSLNYECIFELAASRVGLSVHYPDTAPPPSSVVVWKLHGSCNFIPDPRQISMTREASYMWGMEITAELIPVDPTEAARWVQSNTALYPAMCMFTLNKPSQISPHIFAGYRQKWAEKVSQAKRIVLVGVRPHVPDQHIWEPLASTDGAVYFVGSSSDYENWLPSRNGRASTYLGKKFADTLDGIVNVLKG